MISYMLTETPSKICVDARSGNEFNERNVAADNPNSLASFLLRKFTLAMKLSVRGICESLMSFSNTYVISTTPFKVFA